MESMEKENNFLTIKNSDVLLPIAWDRQDDVRRATIVMALLEFINTLTNEHTQRAYHAAFKVFFNLRLLNPRMTLDQLGSLNIENILDKIRANASGKTESTKQARAAAFISFTGFLHRRTGGLVKKAVPNKEKSNPTFRAEKDKSTSNALSYEQCYDFLRYLREANFRDYLIAKAALQGAKRISEVINARIEDIDWEKKRIAFVQLKSKERQKQTVITYPQNFMDELRAHLKGRQFGPIFITRNGLPVKQPHLYRSFVSAGKAAGIPFRVHPHTLRATAITRLVERGHSVEQIAKVSGHASLKQVVYYDRSDIEINLTNTFSLI